MSSVGTGRALGSRYQLVERLGAGAMGEVWRTRDLVASVDVAAKLLRAEYAGDAGVVARFVQERAVLMALRHPNIVEVRDLVVEGDALAIVMELVPGSDLRTALRARGTFPPAEAVRVTIDVLGAVAHAHAHGVVHRDVKPDNVLVHGDRVRLTDFGIARLTQESTVRATGALGTPEYLAPELISTGQVSAAADVYGTGIQLYELLAGRTPFAGGSNAYAVAKRHVEAAPPPIPGLPPRLAAVLAAMLVKEPRRRLSAAAAAQALTELLPELTGLPALPPQPQPEAWHSDAVAAEPVARRGDDMTSADPNATHLKGVGRVADAAGPVAGAIEALSPAAAPAPTAETTLGGVLPEHVAPALPRPAPAPAAAARGRRLLVAGAVAAGVVLVAGGAVALKARGGDRPAKPAAAVQPVTADEVEGRLPTGLVVSRDAVYDPRSGELRMTVTWQAGRVPLTGPFYENVPVDGCRVAWDTVVAVEADRTPQISAPCGFRIDVGTVRPGSPASATYVVPFDGGDDPNAAVGAFLAAAADRTEAALDKLERTLEYPVQRLTGIVVDVPPVVYPGEIIELRLLPFWAGADRAEPFDALFVAAERGDHPDALTQVAGGTGGIELSVPGCAGAVDVDGLRPFALRHRTSGCRLRATVGEVGPTDSREFRIDLQSDKL